MKKSTKKSLSALLVIVLIIGAYVYFSDNSYFKNIGMVDPKNATYIIDKQPVTLVNGMAEEIAAPGSASKIITKYFGNEATGDVNGDGKNDTVFLLTQETGGSGTFYYVAVDLGGNQGTNAILLGDRIAPQTTEIQNAVIVVNYADRLASEPIATKPSYGVSKYFTVTNAELKEIKNPSTTSVQ